MEAGGSEVHGHPPQAEEEEVRDQARVEKEGPGSASEFSQIQGSHQKVMGAGK